jgi:hypothetical protein
MIGLLLLGAAALTGCTVPEASIREQMRLPYSQFDTLDGKEGWRSLEVRGCVDAAVALLERYRSANGERITADQRRELAFHIGQTLAFAGREREALAYFEQADSPEAEAEWRAYVRATLAFLRRDAKGLAEAREAYRTAPGSDGMRRRVIDGFARCADKSYTEAVHCAM